MILFAKFFKVIYLFTKYRKSKYLDSLLLKFNVLHNDNLS
jgi:hypothetical protein